MTDFQTRTVTAGGLAFHLAEAGPPNGPPVILLHGFPEFWLEWRDLMGPLAEAGFRVIAPDQRGYNLSAKPPRVDDYRLDLLAGDVFALADALGIDRFSVVAHDWGAAVAWWMATIKPARLTRMAVMNAPHPGVWREAMDRDPAQRKKSRYVRMLQTPFLPELSVRAGGYKSLVSGLRSGKRPDSFPPEVIAKYQAAWRRPGALTGMLNWYRALFRQDLPVPPPRSIPTPTLVLWGEQDAFAETSLADLSAALCADVRQARFADASHWLPHDEPEAVATCLLEFLKG